MPYWEDELRSLLASLGVTLENDTAQPPRFLRSDHAPSDSAVREIESHQDDWVSDGDDDEFSIVNREMEATVREVARLVRTGHIEPALRDDIVHVLRALTRPAPLEVADRGEWQLTSAAAVLHFCRVVLRLANALTHQD